MDERHQGRIDEEQGGQAHGDPADGPPLRRAESGDHGDDREPPQLRRIPSPPSVGTDQERRDDRPGEQ